MSRECSGGPGTYFALVRWRLTSTDRQELLLGVGGMRAIKAMNITPGVLHLNEGHSTFAVLEAIRMRMQDEG